MNGRTCASHHFGPWLIDQAWLRQTLAAIQAGVIVPQGESVAVREYDPDTDSVRTLYEIVDGVAVVPIAGAMMKIRSKFGGCCTVDARHALRLAANDPRVKGIMLHIDSPGGTMAGTDALAADVRAIRDSGLPVAAHIEDMGASAAYYVASQAERVTATRASLVGSLGVRMTIIDASENYANEGLKVYELTTGGMKGAGSEGTKITPEQIEYFQRIVDDGLVHFKAAVMSGRGWDEVKAAAMFDGRMHDAEQAKELGLIDGVESFDSAMQAHIERSRTMKAADFREHAAANPEAEEVKEIFTKGYNAAAADLKPKAASLGELKEAFPGEESFVLSQLERGATLDQAKAARADVLQQKLAAAEGDLAKLKAGADAHTREPVSGDAGSSSDSSGEAVNPLIANAERRAQEANRRR
jgi:signal peptide peptidase SppA